MLYRVHWKMPMYVGDRCESAFNVPWGCCVGNWALENNLGEALLRWSLKEPCWELLLRTFSGGQYHIQFFSVLLLTPVNMNVRFRSFFLMGRNGNWKQRADARFMIQDIFIIHYVKLWCSGTREHLIPYVCSFRRKCLWQSYLWNKPLKFIS